MVGILFWELVQRKIDENTHWRIILSLLETKFQIRKTTVFYKAKLFKQIYVNTMWAKLDAFSLMVVKNKQTNKQKKNLCLPWCTEFPSWQNETHKTHKTVCLCTCVLDFHNIQTVILASNLKNNILLVSACMNLLLSFYYYFWPGDII